METASTFLRAEKQPRRKESNENGLSPLPVGFFPLPTTLPHYTTPPDLCLVQASCWSCLDEAGFVTSKLEHQSTQSPRD